MAYWIGFATIYLSFYLVIIDILRILEFMRCQRLFLRFSTSKCSYYVLIFHGMFSPVNVKNSIDFNNSLQLLRAVQELSILCMLDTTFGVWLWPQLNWCNIYILCYIKASFLKNMNNFYCNFLCLNFLICFYFLPISTSCSYISSFL